MQESPRESVRSAREAMQHEHLPLQQAGVLALLGEHQALIPLQITAEQRKQFVVVVQEMEKKIQSLLKQVQDGDSPDQIKPQVMQVRKEHEDQIEAILNESQRKLWKELLARPLDLSD